MNPTITHFHVFCGLGGGAAGFNRGHARLGTTDADFRCLGGVDSDPNAIADFGRLAGTPGTVIDLFDRQQYTDWHGHQPPADWREATPADIRQAAGNQAPDIVFTSPPCKGFSGLLSRARSTSARYQALNRLTVRSLWLTLEAWADDPPAFILLENVPRIATRGADLLDTMEQLLQRYGYATARTTHDCGHLGGLSQSRRRFLLVARHTEKVPPFLYEPPYRPLRTVGDTLDQLPLPGHPTAGAMHQLPRLQWKTWVRLAFVESGGDWRSLKRLNIRDGYLRDYLILPERYGHGGDLGVRPWTQPTGTVAGRSDATNGAFSVADPRFTGHQYGQYGIRQWHQPTGAVSGQSQPGGGRYSVADPRPNWHPGASTNKYRIIDLTNTSGTVIGAYGPADGALSVADPRRNIATGNGYATAGHYGVLPWDSTAGAVTAAAKHDSGRWSIADPRQLPAPNQALQCIIRSLDNTWHRPFTTLELAALQGLIDPSDPAELHGSSHSSWRERIGNAVPPPAAEAIASVMGETILLARAGETYNLGSTPLWVRPLAIAASVRQGAD